MPIITTAISKLSRSDLDCECVIMRGEGVAASIEQSSENEGSRSPGGGGLPELLLGKATDPPHSCEVEAMAGFMTARLAHLVSAWLSDRRRS
jgi:hypothetical protein